LPGVRTLKSISVDLEVMTTDRLKKIIFGLDKSIEDEEIQWVIEFQFLQRDNKTDPFGDPLVKLSIDVKKSNEQAAEETASKGLNNPQASHLLGPGLADTQRFRDGKIPEDKLAATVQRTLPKRNA